MAISETRRKAEKAARVYLTMRGFNIIEQNWSLGRSKLDVIASKNDIVYFVDVNYRAASDSSSELFNTAKHKQKQLASTAWLEESKWPGSFVFSTIEMSGSDYSVVSFTDDLV